MNFIKSFQQTNGSDSTIYCTRLFLFVLNFFCFTRSSLDLTHNSRQINFQFVKMRWKHRSAFFGISFVFEIEIQIRSYNIYWAESISLVVQQFNRAAPYAGECNPNQRVFGRLVGLFYQNHESACIILYFSWNKWENSKLTWHFSTAVLPDITYSSCTCTLYFWLTTVQPMIKSKILNHLEIIYSSEIYIHLITHNISNWSNKKSCPQLKLKLVQFCEPNCFCTDIALLVFVLSRNPSVDQFPFCQNF